MNFAFIRDDTIKFTDMVEVKWDPLADKYWNHTNLSGMHRIRSSENSFTLLMRYLANPSAVTFHKVANAYAIISCFGKPLDPDLSSLPKSLWKFTQLPNAKASKMTCVANLERFVSFVAPNKVSSHGQVVALYNFDDGEKAQADPNFQANWSGFLRAMNVFQFVDAFAATTKSGLEAGLFDSFDQIEAKAQKEVVEISQADAQDKLWDEVAELITDQDVVELVKALRQATIAVPEVGYELVLAGRVLGEVELAWIDAQVGIVTSDYANLVDQFKGEWKLFLAHENVNVDDIVQCLAVG